MSTPAFAFTLPDIFAKFPVKRNLSEHFKETKAESSTWTQSFHFFDEEGLKGFNRCDFNLLAALSYSPRERELIRFGSDLMNLLYVFDEFTDIANGKGAGDIRDIVMDALRNPQKPRPEGELLIGEMARNLWIRASAYVPSGAHCLEHFIEEWDLYSAAVTLEAHDRTNRVYRTFEEYLAIRRYSSGCPLSFVLCEFGLDLPEEAYHHPIMEQLRYQATDLISLDNDICSYALEKSRGLELHNSVELIMNELKLDVQGAMNWIECYALHILDSFLENVGKLPSWGENIDRRIKIYVDGLCQWIRGNNDWTFESGRYFGDRGLEIKQTRVMNLLPASKGFLKN